jgi:hypothetical protein
MTLHTQCVISSISSTNPVSSIIDNASRCDANSARNASSSSGSKHGSALLLLLMCHPWNIPPWSTLMTMSHSSSHQHLGPFAAIESTGNDDYYCYQAVGDDDNNYY